MENRRILLYNTLSGMHSIQRAPKRAVMEDLMGMQAQFARNPKYSLWLRAGDYSPESWDDGLVRTWSHRGAMHVVDGRELGLHLSAAGYSGDMPYTETYWGLSQGEQSRWSGFISEQVLSGNDSRQGLRAACERAGMDSRTLDCVFNAWGGLIKEMAWRGKLVCRTGTDKRYAVPEPPVFMERDKARAIFIRRYFSTFGPATAEDCISFFRYKRADIYPLLRAILPELSRTDIDGTAYYHARPLITRAELPPCVLLPGFDQSVQAYDDRSRLISEENLRKVVNMAGIVFPIAVVRGLARARWRLEGGAAVVTPFERLYKKDEEAIKRAFRREMDAFRGGEIERVVFAEA